VFSEAADQTATVLLVKALAVVMVSMEQMALLAVTLSEAPAELVVQPA
jgi:hypothetical protein